MESVNDLFYAAPSHLFPIGLRWRRPRALAKAANPEQEHFRDSSDFVLDWRSEEKGRFTSPGHSFPVAHRTCNLLRLNSLHPRYTGVVEQCRTSSVTLSNYGQQAR